MTGIISYHAGLAAEDIVSRTYQAAGFWEEQRRWDGPGGEVDLILGSEDMTVFVEVKKSKSFASAAARITAHQMQGVEASAAGYLENLPEGQNSNARIDVALVDGEGKVEIIENVTMH